MGRITPKDREALRQVDGLVASGSEHLLMVAMDGTRQVKRLPRKLRKYERRLDYVLLAKNVVLAHKIGAKLRCAYPSAPKKALKDVSVGFADLWRVCETHRRNMRELVRISAPANRKRIDEILEVAGYQHALEAEEHYRELRRAIPRLLQSAVNAGKKASGRK